MAFPSSPVNTTNLDSSADDPSLARADLLDAVTKLNAIIDEVSTAGGVVVLDGSGYIDTAQLPATQTIGGTLTLAPSTEIVNIQSILRLSPKAEADILLIDTPIEGDIALCSNLLSSTANVGGIAFYTGTAWVGLPWSSNVFVSMS